MNTTVPCDRPCGTVHTPSCQCESHSSNHDSSHVPHKPGIYSRPLAILVIVALVSCCLGETIVQERYEQHSNGLPRYWTLGMCWCDAEHRRLVVSSSGTFIQIWGTKSLGYDRHWGSMVIPRNKHSEDEQNATSKCVPWWEWMGISEHEL